MGSEKKSFPSRVHSPGYDESDLALQKTQADPSLEIKYQSIPDPWVLREGLSVHVGKWNFLLVVIKAERSHFLQLTFPGPKIFEKVLKKNLALYKGTLGGYSK